MPHAHGSRANRAGWQRLLARAALELTAISVLAPSVAFVMLHRAGGTPDGTLGGDPRMDAVARRAWARGFDPDTSVPVRWWRFVRDALGGDFGWSWSQQRPVLDVLRETLPYTLGLVIPALVLALTIGVWIGSRHAVDPHGLPRRDQPATSPAVVQLLGVVPPAWVALCLASLFGATLHWLPFQGVCDPRDCAEVQLASPGSWLRRVPYAILPVSALALVLLPLFTRLQRQALVAVAPMAHVRAAAARGVPPVLLRSRHLQRLTWLPLASGTTIALPALLGGAVFVERVFAWPGLGTTLLHAVAVRDYPMVAAVSWLAAVGGVLSARALQLLSHRIDPRPPWGTP